MNHQEHIDKISDLIKDLKFTMMTTVTHEGHLHACPMTTNQFDLARKEILVTSVITHFSSFYFFDCFYIFLDHFQNFLNCIFKITCKILSHEVSHDFSIGFRNKFVPFTN